MNVTIEGNKHSYQLTQKSELITLSLDITLPDAIQPPTFNLHYDNYNISFNNSQCNSIAETIKGRQAFDVMFALQRILPEYPEFAGSFLSKSQTETSLFQSLFLIYQWMEFDLKFSALNVAKKIYDDFIVEYTGHVGPAADIYFIKLQRINNDNMNYIQKLLQLSLLAKATFANNLFGNTVIAYFIPLLKPGVSRSFFAGENDPNGERTYKFWKQILSDRDDRLQLWSTKRF